MVLGLELRRSRVFLMGEGLENTMLSSACTAYRHPEKLDMSNSSSRFRLVRFAGYIFTDED